MGLINTVYHKGGKNKMIFGGICIVAGILVFVLFDQLKNKSVSIFGIEILHSLTSSLGRVGFSALYLVGGTIVGLWGFMEQRKEKQNQSQG